MIYILDKPNFNICAPIGGFGNHVRWLLMLDSSVYFYTKSDIDDYQCVQGPSWPSFKDYVNDHWVNTDVSIQQEIQHILQDINFSTLDQKTAFIKNKIYNSTRSWHNWLKTEWAYRSMLDQVIEFKHTFGSLEKHKQKTLLLTIDPDLAYSCYLKFNSNLNNESVESFKLDKVATVNSMHMELASHDSNKKIISADILYQPTLDRNFYNQIINWLNLDDTYDKANEIHQLWYQGHQRSQQEFVSYISNFYK